MNLNYYCPICDKTIRIAYKLHMFEHQQQSVRDNYEA